MTPFRASPGFTESWQHFDFTVDVGTNATPLRAFNFKNCLPISSETSTSLTFAWTWTAR
jgi:hypothetical protein